ncbi:Hpt domain-containing protein [Neptunomonas sp.]|uniref:Hpt domain-containing protein n=1 Tax=Neptunomonas sp. TaxID=1971898 RepID=UPI003564CD94
MLERLFGKHSSKARIAIGQASIIVSLVLIAAILGLLPNESNISRQARLTLAETIATNASLFITRADIKRMHATLEVTVKRNPELLSAGVRRRDDALLADIADHSLTWVPREGEGSTDTDVVVPVWEGEQQWGQVELRFSPIQASGIWGFITNPVSIFVLFLSSSSFIIFFWYLGKMLKQLDPSQAIPDRVRSALDTMAESLIVMDVKQNIVLANQAFATLVDRPAEKLVGLKASSFPWKDHEDDDSVEKYPWKIAMDSGKPITNHIVRLQLSDDIKKSFMVNCSPVLLPGGKVGGVLVSLDDVTELEEKDIELRRSKDEAEMANRAKSEFLANMSHEIRTPMNAILGFTELLRRDRGGLQPEQRKHLNTISSSGQHLLDLINDILDLSKVEAGHLDVETIDCKPVQLIQQVMQTMKVKADEKGLELNFVADSDLPDVISTDPGRVRQILTNLIGNSIKFTDKGAVTVRVCVPDRSDPQLHIDVVDTGIGMTEQQVNSVFDPFVQADSSITRRFGGTGLGLSISQKFAHALGGDILVKSTAGQGSTFSLVLDVDDSAETSWLTAEELFFKFEQDESPEKFSWRLPKASILVVDDGNENRELVRLVLEDLGLDVVTGVHGQDGLEKVAASHFDIILMDVQMPVMDGYAAVKAMREMGIKQPVVALTAHAMKGIEMRCMEAGYSHYMTKPIDIEALISLLAELLGGEKIIGVHTEKHADVDSVSKPALSHPDKRASLEPLVSGLAVNVKFSEIIERFVSKLGLQIEAMDAALETQRFADLADLAHWLKGSAGSVGYGMFTEVAQELEEAAKASDASAVSENLAVVKQYHQRACLGLETLNDPGYKADVEKSAEKFIATSPETNSGKSAETKTENSRGIPPILTTPAKIVLQSTLSSSNAKYEAIVQRFVERLQEQIVEMQRTILVADYPALADLGHWLKGSAGSLGFADLTEPALELETAAKRADKAAVTASFEKVMALIFRIKNIDAELLLSKLQGLSGPSTALVEQPKIRSKLLVKNEKFRPIVERFVTRLHEQVDAMSSAHENMEFEALAELAHWLKGAAGSVGLDEFTKPADDLEQFSKVKNLKRCESVLHLIKTMVQQIEI